MVYTDISQILKDDKRIVDDFSNADLSNLDLSNIPPKAWEDATFYNTNFSGTNIKFYPKKLRMFDTMHTKIEGCDFSDCELLPWEAKDLKYVIINNCNFKGSNLKVDFTDKNVFYYKTHGNIGVADLSGCILPDYYNSKPSNYWDTITIDTNFLEKNKDITVSSGKILELLKTSITSPMGKVLSNSLKKERLEKANSILKYDKEGKVKKLHDALKPYFDDDFDEQLFLSGIVFNKDFKDLDLSFVTPYMWNYILFDNCTFEKLKLGCTYKDIESIYKSREDAATNFKEIGFLINSNVKDLEMPITVTDFDNNKIKRLIHSGVTFQSNLYLEMQRACNMECSFCRNNGLDTNDKYDYEKITYNLEALIPHLNNIFIGGGEPTLFLDELEKLGRYLFEKTNPLDMLSERPYIITNTSLGMDGLIDLARDKYRLIISRHAVDDSLNREIFGDKDSIILDSNDLANLANLYSYFHENILCCTCFPGGVDDTHKILEYIAFAQELGYENIIFQTLHKEDKFNVKNNSSLKDDFFLDTFKYLSKIGYRISGPVYSNSSYEMYKANFQRMSITFKEYKDPLVIYNKWNSATKRCFDLSMAPDGNIYNTWDQDRSPIKIKRP